MTFASAHNGGRSQVNLNFCASNSGEFPFLNLMKNSGSWIDQATSGGVSATLFDVNGYPTSVHGVFATIFFPPMSERPGERLVLTWDGIGTMTVVATGLTTVSGSLTNVSSPGRYEFTCSSSVVSLTVGIGSWSSQITNIKLFYSGDETALNAGQTFGTQFLARLREGRFGVIRFLNWMEGTAQGDAGNQVLWAQRKPLTYFTWAGQEPRASLSAGTTTNVGDDYSISFGSGGPTDKLLILATINATKSTLKTSVTFNSGTSQITWPAHGLNVNDPVGFGLNSGSLPTSMATCQNFYVRSVIDANTITISQTVGGSLFAFGTGASGDPFGMRQPTINLNGTGPVPVKTFYGATLGNTTVMQANGQAAFFYDAPLGSWLMNGGGGAGAGHRYLDHGVPPEICLQLCAEVGAHPWFVLPMYTTDPMTDYMSSLAAYCRDNMPSWMVPRFEAYNEFWNGNSPVTQYGFSKSFINGYGQANTHNQMGKIMSQMGQAIFAVYSNNTTKFQTICGVQTTLFSALPIHSQDPRLLSTLYVAGGGQPAYLYTTHVCCAQYMDPTAYHNAAETAFVTQWNNGADPTALASCVDTLNSGNGFANLPNLNTYYQNIKAWAASCNVNRMCGYEGGYSPDYLSDGKDTFREACKGVSHTTLKGNGLHDYLIMNYNSFTAAGGEFPSCFQLGGANPPNNIWSVLQDVYVSPNPPQWEAIRLYNNNKRRFLVKTG